MRKLRYILCLLLLIYGFDLQAQIAPISQSYREEKQEKIQSRWARLIPKQNKLQFAGSMGMFSGSVGWYYGKRNQWETDWYLGFIPKTQNQKGHMTTTLKQTYTPWRLTIKDGFFIEPLTTGIYINKIFGEYFWTKLPDRYPENYYFWAVDTRFNIFAGQAFTWQLNDSHRGKEFSFFYEISTNDLYLISAVGNKTITLRDIIGLSFGFRYRVF
ncbi:hypothetical protein [Mangrovibacterium lignilyticum]|uniref:hypothetical protein n=1 Tax=Mangrovibacterium lignilyticum TaxID=2668052 RepID=UPI0013D5B725|nr:hypothetical protein [Mangrovibacterium lignilyticum]